jgi:hypothetical protein
MKRGSSETATGTASEANKTVEITLRGKIYKGHYTFVEQGFSTFTTGYATSGTRSAWGNGVGYAAASAGQGNILARASDGSGLRCNFSFSNSSYSGMGECQDDQGGIWDMQISMGSGNQH